MILPQLVFPGIAPFDRVVIYARKVFMKSAPARRHFDGRQLDRRDVVGRHFVVGEATFRQADPSQRERFRGRLNLDLAVAEFESANAAVQAWKDNSRNN